MIDKDGLLEAVYARLVKNFESNTDAKVNNIDSPHSKVHYVRAALFERLGTNFPLEHIQISLWLEGELHPSTVQYIPKWYVVDYMRGVRPDMVALRKKLKLLYNIKRSARVSSSTDG